LQQKGKKLKKQAGERQLPSKRLTGQAWPGRIGLHVRAESFVIVPQTENQNKNGETYHEKHNHIQ